MQASMLEVYNEEIKDLLGKGPPAGSSHAWPLPCSLLSSMLTTGAAGGLSRCRRRRGGAGRQEALRERRPSCAGKKHTVSHSDRTGCTTVSHLEAVDCRDPSCVAALLQQAAKQRAVGATAANERSSRSHMVFTLSVCGLRSADGQQINGARSRPSLVLLGAEMGPVPMLLHARSMAGSHAGMQMAFLVTWSGDLWLA